MPRRVVPRVPAQVAVPAGGAIAAAPAETQPQGDSYLTRVIKYIPAEIIAIYVIVDGFLKTGKIGSLRVDQNLYFLIFAGFLVATPIYTYFATRKPGAPLATGQILISAISFAAWVFALGGPFATLKPFYPDNGAIISAILLPAVILLAGLIAPKPQAV